MKKLIMASVVAGGKRTGRFFRYENDPEEGKKLDLLFIPLWR